MLKYTESCFFQAFVLAAMKEKTQSFVGLYSVATLEKSKASDLATQLILLAPYVTAMLCVALYSSEEIKMCSTCDC